MSSELQIEANRLNAQHSTGPSTPEGRVAVRLNGLKYGLYAETLILPGEDPAERTQRLSAPAALRRILPSNYRRLATPSSRQASDIKQGWATSSNWRKHSVY